MFEFKIEDLEKARKIVSILNLPKEFGCSNGDFDTTFIEYQLEEVVNGDFYVTNGISKLVIDIDDLPFVIKIPFNGQWLEDYEDYDDSEYHESFFSFTQAGDGYENDYCAAELDATCFIEDEGFGYFVPDMMYLCTCCDKAIYVQEKVKPLSECRNKITPSIDSLSKAKETCSPFISEWLALVFDKYGEKAYKDFTDWAYMWGPNILSDMHSGNYGVDMQGFPVIFDISGFRD